MSVNKYTTAEGLVTLANGSRMWVGTKAAHDVAKQAGTLPTNCLIAITDDEDDGYYQEWHELVTMANTGSAYHTFVNIPENIHELLIITKYNIDMSGTTRQAITSTMYLGKHLIAENKVYQIVSVDWYDGGSPGNGLVRQGNCVVGSTQFDFWKDSQGHEDIVVYYR